jgi:chemotaxis protein MotB
MHDDSTTTTLSDDAAGSAQNPLVQQIAQPVTVAPKAPAVAVAPK